MLSNSFFAALIDAQVHPSRRFGAAGIARLNRGLARERLVASEKALADLDLVVR